MDKFIDLAFSILAGALSTLIATIVWKLIENHRHRKNKDTFKKTISDGKRKGRIAIFIVCLFILSLIVWNEILGPNFSHIFITSSQIEKLIHGYRWISYDPTQYNPYNSSNPDINSIEKELNWIKKAGFTGVITFTSNDNFALIPELAKKKKLRVIMGIWDPNSKHEVALAISKKNFVDAYSVGHNQISKLYSYKELKKTIQKIRFRTKHPVSTTEKLRHYLEDHRLFEICDWLFPDCHVSIRDEESAYDTGFFANAIRDGKKTIEMANMIAKQVKNQKPILLKMITYPMNGISNASLQEQTIFFVIILDSIKDSIPEMPSNVSVSMHSAFDIPWKIGGTFYDWDPYTGLLNIDGTPRPVVEEIVSRLQ